MQNYPEQHWINKAKKQQKTPNKPINLTIANSTKPRDIAVNMLKCSSDTMVISKSFLIRCSVQNSIKKAVSPAALNLKSLKIKLKRSFEKVSGPPPKFSASGRRTGSNLEHC